MNDLDIKGIKLGPNYQDFHPHSIEAMKLYSRLENDNIPILFHQGTSPVTNAPLEYSHPRYIDKIATVFPNLKMIVPYIYYCNKNSTLNVRAISKRTLRFKWS